MMTAFGYVVFFILLQSVVAYGVVFFLMRRLHRELVYGALEQLMMRLKPDSSGIMTITLARPVSGALQAQLEQVVRQKNTALKIEYLHDAALKAGIIFQWGNEYLDFTLAKRWQGQGS